eukprot:CAMPEP_0116875340 /NCGR_PEP_ID=MMETSP0463-20121206/7244_1 /TAXON_ID=181622 /ORGANISM="Strombidinopsis sp, Strain SopsisLIS2011" /LENGTH=91 /DNA_ID=CAMNT_0004520771 /DNA_START=1081 /DNA_END=1356 /DNA_ORIENTATION=-
MVIEAVDAKALQAPPVNLVKKHIVKYALYSTINSQRLKAIKNSPTPAQANVRELLCPMVLTKLPLNGAKQKFPNKCAAMTILIIKSEISGL